ncbi:MAG: carbamoyltransferase HypF [Terracidiphilus sp.]|jgi:hydrogenase maturation protein HypF
MLGTPPKPIRREVRVQGVVQGVGFRPFVYRLAREESLAGFIGNDTDGVIIEVEGEPDQIASFLRRLREESPALARIDSVISRDVPPKQEEEFHIVASEVRGQVATGIPADAATCPDCLRELLDPEDRRYRYPFLNCTNCGPRFTITRRIPYDRPQTSMAKFQMCPACQAEYDDPANRRFHAQPNACWQCGPLVWLVGADSAQSWVPQVPRIWGSGKAQIPADEAETGEGYSPIAETIRRLLDGQILAIKGIGGFHLACDATKEAAVMRLRERKHRYGKPLAIMVRDLCAARAIAQLTPEEETLLATFARPIVLVRARASGVIAPSVAPGVPWLGIFLPYAPLQHLLFADTGIRALVMTSANLSEEPIAIDNDEALTRLTGVADAFLMHDREILQRCDDSVTAVVDSAPQLIRRARGFVPLSVPLNIDAPPLLAVGGHLKNAFALARGRFVYQSQHLGDLENLTGLNFFRESLDHLMRTFEVAPTAVAHDLHPGYLSTTLAREWAAERGLPLIAVQHHHAHIASCMAEHALAGPIIGLSLDGTGYGTDGKIWGGEVLIVRLDGPSPATFDRFAHLEYVPMPGGEKTIREPWRMALGALHAAGFDIESEEVRSLVGARLQEARVVKQMIERGINTPLTSSLGRLFDAVAAVALGRGVVDYEAQAAIELEGVAIDEDDRLRNRDYVPELWEGDGSLILKTENLWKRLIDDLRRGASPSRIAAEFHAGIAEGFIRSALNAKGKTGINQVALSGGCMHNRRLSLLLRAGLEKEGFQVFQHRHVSPGDGGLSYGQAAVAATILASQS